MKMRSMILMAAAAGLGLCGLARGSVSYTYVVQPQGGAIVPGGNNTLNLYLQEVSSGTSFQATQDGGLYSGGVALVEQAGGTGVTFTASGVNNNSSAEPSGFSGNNTKGLVTSGGAWIGDITGNSATVGVAPVSSTTTNGTTTSLYLLGSVTVGVASNANANFLVESLHDSPANDGVTDAGSDFNTLTYNSLYDLDQTGAAGAPGATGADGHPTTFAITTSAVPEPASLAVFSLGALGLLRRRRSAV